MCNVYLDIAHFSPTCAGAIQSILSVSSIFNPTPFAISLVCYPGTPLLVCLCIPSLLCCVLATNTFTDTLVRVCLFELFLTDNTFDSPDLECHFGYSLTNTVHLPLADFGLFVTLKTNTFALCLSKKNLICSSFAHTFVFICRK